MALLITVPIRHPSGRAWVRVDKTADSSLHVPPGRVWPADRSGVVVTATQASRLPVLL